MKRTNNKKLCVLVVGLVVILLVAFGVLYRSNQYGILKINASDENLIIFIDNQEKTFPPNNDLEFKLKNGQHSIILSKEGFWPWTKKVEIIKKGEIEVAPFFVPQNTSGMLIGESDSEYTQILSLFEKNLILDEALKKIADDNSILKSAITAIDFYKTRKDVAVIALADGIYALEINSQNIQNFQPIYKGGDPLFVKKDNNYIYILDKSNLMIVNY